MKSVKFEVVEIWYNGIYNPYTIKPESKNSIKNYAIKVGDNFFLLGDEDAAVYICDYEGNNENQ